MDGVCGQYSLQREGCLPCSTVDHGVISLAYWFKVIVEVWWLIDQHIRCSVIQSCPTLCNSLDCSTPSFPVLHHLLKFAQTHVHWIDAIQPSHPLLFPSPLALNLCQLQSLFQWVGCSQQVAKLLELQLQHQSFQWIFRVDFLWDWLLWCPYSPRDSQESSPAPQLKSTNSLVLSLLYGRTLTSIQDYWKNHSFD